MLVTAVGAATQAKGLHRHLIGGEQQLCTGWQVTGVLVASETQCRSANDPSTGGAGKHLCAQTDASAVAVRAGFPVGGASLLGASMQASADAGTAVWPDGFA